MNMIECIKLLVFNIMELKDELYVNKNKKQ